MKRITCILIAVLSLAITASAQSQKPLHYRQKNDIAYHSEANAYAKERCKLDVYYPTLTEEKLPVVVFFHGGGLTSGNKYVPAELKDSRLVVITVNYRLMEHSAKDGSCTAGIADCIDDAAAAVAWAFRHAAEYGGDTSRIYVSGHSAGGYLTDMIGLEKKWLEKYGVDADSIKGLFPFSGQTMTHFGLRTQQGLTPLQPTIGEFAPIAHIRPDCPPIYLMSADRNLELYGRYEESAYFWRMITLMGHKAAYLYEFDGFDHGDMVVPGCILMKKIIRKDR